MTDQVHDNIVVASSLTKRFHGFAAVSEVDLAVRRHSIHALIGPNGAGKTTMFNLITKFLSPTEGSIHFNGVQIEKTSTPDIATSGVAYVPEAMAIFSDLTVKENLVLAARAGAPDEKRLEWIFGFFPALRKFWLSRAGTLSGGQKQMLSIARAIVEERKLLLIDEPTKGLAPAIVATMARALRELKADGASILLVEQNFAVAKALGDTASVMDDGRVVWSGAMAELGRDADLQERLMGLSMEAR